MLPDIAAPWILWVLFYTIKVNQFPSKVYSTYNLHEFLFAEAEAESTYQSSAEAKTVVAEAAQKTARKTCRSRNKLYRVLGTAQLLFLDCCWTPHCLKILDYGSINNCFDGLGSIWKPRDGLSKMGYTI